MFFSCLLPAVDVWSDLVTAYEFFANGDGMLGGLTFVLILAPWFVRSMTFQDIVICHAESGLPGLARIYGDREWYTPISSYDVIDFCEFPWIKPWGLVKI